MWQADSATQQRFQSRSIEVRLGSIASNLLLISRYLQDQNYPQLVIDQTLAYIDWAVEDMPEENAQLLAELKKTVQKWRSEWSSDPCAAWEPETVQTVQCWSDQVMKRSGLLTE